MTSGKTSVMDYWTLSSLAVIQFDISIFQAVLQEIKDTQGCASKAAEVAILSSEKGTMKAIANGTWKITVTRRQIKSVWKLIHEPFRHTGTELILIKLNKNIIIRELNNKIRT